jgi:hypothetical protein
LSDKNNTNAIKDKKYEGDNFGKFSNSNVQYSTLNTQCSTCLQSGRDLIFKFEEHYSFLWLKCFWQEWLLILQTA